MTFTVVQLRCQNTLVHRASESSNTARLRWGHSFQDWSQRLGCSPGGRRHEPEDVGSSADVLAVTGATGADYGCGLLIRQDWP